MSYFPCSSWDFPGAEAPSKIAFDWLEVPKKGNRQGHMHVKSVTPLVPTVPYCILLSYITTMPYIPHDGNLWYYVANLWYKHIEPIM